MDDVNGKARFVSLEPLLFAQILDSFGLLVEYKAMNFEENLQLKRPPSWCEGPPWVDLDATGYRGETFDVLVRSHVRAAMAESWMPSQICLHFEGAALQKRSVLSCRNCIAGW
jgi:hypothetical protein